MTLAAKLGTRRKPVYLVNEAALTLHLVARERHDLRHQVVTDHAAVPLLHRLHIEILKHHQVKALGYRAGDLVAKIQALAPDFVVELLNTLLGVLPTL